MTVREVIFTSADKSSRVYGLLYLPDQPKAMVQIIHDAVEHMQLYNELILALFREGYAVCVHDQVGHGRTAADEGSLGHFGPDGAKILLADIHKMTRIAKKEAGELPLFLLGHGMGAALCRLNAAGFPGLSGMILSGERKTGALRDGFNTVDLLLRGGDRRGLRCVRKTPEKAALAYTDDPELLQKLKDDRLVHFELTLFARREVTRIQRLANRRSALESLSDIPVLLLAGAEDPSGRYGAAAERLFHRLGRYCSELTLRMFPEGKGQPYLEQGREEVFSQVLEWLNGRFS